MHGAEPFHSCNIDNVWAASFPKMVSRGIDDAIEYSFTLLDSPLPTAVTQAHTYTHRTRRPRTHTHTHTRTHKQRHTHRHRHRHTLAHTYKHGHRHTHTHTRAHTHARTYQGTHPQAHTTHSGDCQMEVEHTSTFVERHHLTYTVQDPFLACDKKAAWLQLY